LLTPGVKLEFALDGLPEVLVDEFRVKQVIVNLLGNAAKFCRTGSVRVGGRVQDGFVEVLVSDTGEGISPEKQALLFKRYEQGGADVVRSHGGTGLGLSICKQLVEMHGGRIWVESEVGIQTTFHFTLPRLDTVKGERLEAKVDENSDVAGGRLFGKVGVDELFHQVVASRAALTGSLSAFETAGYKVLLADTDSETWEVARLLRPSYVLLRRPLRDEEGGVARLKVVFGEVSAPSDLHRLLGEKGVS